MIEIIQRVPTLGKSKGFALIEIIIAMACWSIIFPSFLYLVFQQQSSLKKFDSTISSINSFIENLVQTSTTEWDRGVTLYSKTYTKKHNNRYELNYIDTDWQDAFARKSCRDLNSGNLKPVLNSELKLGDTNNASSIEVLNGIIYLTTNSASTTDPDFFIIDSKQPSLSYILSKIDTGPGLNSIHVVKDVAYVGNTSSKSQLQAIDIKNVTQPKILWSYAVEGANASTSPITKAIYYYRGKIVLGTEKTILPELYLIDVSSGYPVTIDSKEIGAGINSLYVKNNNIYVLSPLDPEVQVFSMTTIPILQLSTYDAPGNLGNGKKIDLFNSEFYFGRTVGGEELNLLSINNSQNSNQDLNLNLATNTATTSISISNIFSYKVKATIDGIISSQDYVYVLTSDSTKELQIFRKVRNSSGIVISFLLTQAIDLPARANGMSCDGGFLYVSLTAGTPIKVFKSAVI